MPDSPPIPAPDIDARLRNLFASVESLRVRVEALEFGGAPPCAKPLSLVDRIEAVAGGDGRRALREIAAYLRHQYPTREGTASAWAILLEEHANR